MHSIPRHANVCRWAWWDGSVAPFGRAKLHWQWFLLYTNNIKPRSADWTLVMTPQSPLSVFLTVTKVKKTTTTLTSNTAMAPGRERDGFEQHAMEHRQWLVQLENLHNKDYIKSLAALLASLRNSYKTKDTEFKNSSNQTIIKGLYVISEEKAVDSKYFIRGQEFKCIKD